MKVVLDANVYVSAFINTHGAPKQIIDFWQAEAFELLTSDPILAEIDRVLRYPKIAKLHKLTEQELQEFLALLQEETQVVSPTQRLQVSTDEPDNRYLECAMAGLADYLVTGDKKHLLPISEYGGFRIISPTSFVTLLKLEQQ
jgi:putative PIN family toxin of toxin-antitoxin system